MRLVWQPRSECVQCYVERTRFSVSRIKHDRVTLQTPVAAASAARTSLCLGKGACTVLDDNMSAFLGPSNCRSLIIVESEESPYCRGYRDAVDLA